MNTTSIGDPGDPFVMMDHTTPQQQQPQQPYNNNNNNNNNNTADYYSGNPMLSKLSQILEKKQRVQDINLIGKKRTALLLLSC